MQSFLAGHDVTLTFNASTLGLTLTSASYRVVDEDGIELISATGVSTSTPAAVGITVPAVKNSIVAGKGAAARTVELTLVGTGLASGCALMTSSYAITLANRLIVPSVSFQNLTSAELLAMDLASLDGWNGASDTQKVAALIEARERLCKLHFRFDPLDWQNRVTGWFPDYKDFALITLDEFNALDERFRLALKRAQVVEASELIGRSEDLMNRDAGVVSVTIGDSSRTYLQQKAARYPVSGRAMSILSRYLAAKRLTRT